MIHCPTQANPQIRQDVLVKWYYPGHVRGVDSIQEALLYVSVEHDLNVEMRLLVHVKLECHRLTVACF